MKKITAKILLALALAPAWISPAADNADNLSRLDQALKAVAAFEYGKDSAPLTLTEQIVVESATNNVQRAAVEERLLHLLHSQATRDAKEFVCRQLFTIGTERSIPQLEALLTDPGLAHVARLALGRNESPAALESLLRAVAAAPATIQIGIINTLGLRRYEAALPALEKLVASGDLQIAKAAASALGEIGGTKAVKILQANRAKAGEELRRSIDAALLASADHFLASGEIPAASEIYEGLYAPTQTGNFRIAALRGLAAAQQEKALPTLAAAMRGADIGMRAAAISFTSSLKGSGSTRGLVDLLPTLAVETQPLLLNALGARGDGVAIPGVLAAVQSENASVRAAALIALGAIGDSSVVSSLLRAAGGTAGPEPAAARASLVQLHRGDVNGTLVRAFSGGDTKIVMEAIRALAGRRATATFQDIRKMVGGADPAVRLEAIHALGILADENTYSDLVSLAAGLKNSEDLGSLEDAVTAALPRVSSPEKQAAPLLSMLNGSSAAAKPVLLRLLSITGAPGALLALQAALKDSNPLVAEAAVRSLSDWPDAGPADDLLKLAQTATVPAYKVFALRGYVRMAALGKDPGAMYARALSLAERPEDKKLVLSSLGAAEPTQAIALVEPFLQSEGLKTEAALAVVQIADRLRQTDNARAKRALLAVMAATSEPTIRQQAQEVMNQVEALEAYILEWVGSGPYQEKDKDVHALFDTVFPPERADAGDAKWVRLTKGIGTWDVNLADALGNGGDNLVGYARTRVWSESARPARLELGSDDGIKAWLNGEVVHANNTERGLAPRQDAVKVTLKEGWNQLLLKVTNAGGGWGFGCRFRAPDGTALEGLKYEAK